MSLRTSRKHAVQGARVYRMGVVCASLLRRFISEMAEQALQTMSSRCGT